MQVVMGTVRKTKTEQGDKNDGIQFRQNHRRPCWWADAGQSPEQREGAPGVSGAVPLEEQQRPVWLEAKRKEFGEEAAGARSCRSRRLQRGLCSWGSRKPLSRAGNVIWLLSERAVSVEIEVGGRGRGRPARRGWWRVRWAWTRGHDRKNCSDANMSHSRVDRTCCRLWMQTKGVTPQWLASVWPLSLGES